MMMPLARAAVPRGLPTYAAVLAELAEAEQQEGWMARCVDKGRYLALNLPFVEALAAELRSLGGGPVLEICAGDGSLASALSRVGVEVIATDVSPPAEANDVRGMAAREALSAHRPRVVLGGFVPADSGVDRQVLESPYVQHYLILDARVGGELGSSHLWLAAGWERVPIDAVTRWMACRHDVWLGPGTPPLRRGEAWRFSRHANHSSQ
jgi:hypothetical protein